MSWRGSAEHIDANVPDYQKMLQGRYTASEWSSIPSMQPSYASGAHTSSQTGHYMNSRPTISSYTRPSSQHSYLNTYQPSKYGITSYNKSLESNINTLEVDDDLRYLSDRKAYIDKDYGILGKEFDLGPFRSQSRKETDYSSDTGTRRVRSRPADYSSDSGMGYRRQTNSSEYDVDLPSPDVTDRRQSDDIFHSPVKNQTHGISDIGLSDNQPLYSDGNSTDHVQTFSPRTAPLHGSSSSSGHSHHSRSSDRGSKSNNITNIRDYGVSKDSPKLQIDSHNTHINSSENNDKRLNFFSPPLYKGDINSTSLAKNEATSKSSRTDDLTHWQRQHQQRNANVDVHSPREHSPYRQHQQRNTQVVQQSPRDPSPYRHHKQRSVTVDDHSPRDHSPYRQHPQRNTAGGDEYSPRDPSPYTQYSHRDKHVSYNNYNMNESFDGDDLTSPRIQNGRDPSPRGHGHDKPAHKHVILPATEAIIRDKDAIIEDFKAELDTKLELIKKYENELLRAQTSRRGGHTDPSPTFSKMQELEYRNAELRSELNKLQKQKHCEVEELEIKLGGAEHEIDQLKSALKKSQPNLMDMKEKMFEKEKEVDEWKSKCSVLTKTHQQLEEKVGGLERYLSELPTIEEFTKTAEELSSCREDNDVKADQLETLEKRLAETTKKLSEKETTIMELEEKQGQLGGRVRELASEIHHIRSGGDGKALCETRDELAEVREVKDRYAVDLQKAKKLLEMTHRKTRQLEAKHVTEVRQLEERLGQEEASVNALREEVRLKEEQIDGLKKIMKELASKKQELRNETLILQEQLAQVERLSDDDSLRLQRRVVKEMSNCFSELNALAQICIQRAEGKDPNVSLLLGMRGMTLDEEDEPGGEGACAGREEQTLQHWLANVKDLRHKIEEVRKMICEKYAEEMGDNLNCATQ